jgi:DNA-binding SARP family transcriptional activator
MEFGILGPLEVRVDGRPVPVTAPKQRTLLAALLLQANQVVSSERLIEVLWGEDPPASARAALQSHVLQLRRLLPRAGGDDEGAGALLTRPPGYLLRLEPCRLDLRRFQELVADAQLALREGEFEEAAAGLREALRLWRGPALCDVESDALRWVEAPRLEELRLAALEARVEADLQLGRHAELVGELQALLATHPLRERVAAQLMLALYRSGRQAEALDVFAAVRRRLVEDLGLDPGEELQRLHRAVLAGDPALQGPGTVSAGAGRSPKAAPLVPRELPGPIAEFTGRTRELEELHRLLDATGDAAGRPVVITAIDGMGGVGKSALAVQAAHLLADRYPDGQLYVNLHGATPGQQPVAPLRALHQLLRSLGLEPAAIPARVEEAAARLRSLAAGRRLLLLLDNARSIAQVRPLLPGSPTCAVLVTSRQVLATLEGAHPLHLDLLPHGEALELLGRISGPQRVGAEPSAAAEVVRLCSRLPLAIRIAGARLAARPSWPIGELADRLADATRRLDELTTEGLAVRAAFDVSLEALARSPDAADRAAADAFAFLSLPDGPDLDVEAAARLLGLGRLATGELLERLVDAHLLETPRPGRYQFHDLVRLHARQLAARDHPEDERMERLGRLWGFYTATAWNTLARIRPGDRRLARAAPPWTRGGRQFDDELAALDWLEAERPNLLAAVAQAAAAVPLVPAELPGQLVQAMHGFFSVRSYWADCVQANQAALQLALRTGDQAARAEALNDLGVGCEQLGRYPEALAHHSESLAIRRELGDLRGQSASLGNSGRVLHRLGRHQEAITCLQQGLALDRFLDDRRGQAAWLGNLGTVYERLGRHQEAVTCLQESLANFRERGERHGVASILGDLGRVYQRMGRHQEAMTCLEQALALAGELGDEVERALCLNTLGRVHQSLGDHRAAIDCHRDSVTLLREMNYRHALAEALLDLGEALGQAGRPRQARRRWQEALAIYEELQVPEADEVRSRLAAVPLSPPSDQLVLSPPARPEASR